MRKLVVLLTIVALASSMMMVLGGCGSAAPAEQPAAAPTETTAPLQQPTATAAPTETAAPLQQPTATAAPTETAAPPQKPTATVATPLVEDSVSTPTPASSASDGIEFAPVDSFGSFKKQDPITVADPDSPKKDGPRHHWPCPG